MTSRYRTALAVFALLAAGFAAPRLALAQEEPVEWRDAMGVTVSSGSLAKTAPTGWNAAAVSSKVLVAGDGYVEFGTAEATTEKVCGLSRRSNGLGYEEIEYGFRFAEDGTLGVIESGVVKQSVGVYTASDRFRVAVSSGVVEYRVNGTLVYTSTRAPLYPLLVDTALYTSDATIEDAVVSGELAETVVWTNAVGVTVSGNSLTRGTAAAGWTAGAVSTKGIASLDGYVEFVASEANTHRRIGLSNGDINQGYQDIDFAIYLDYAGNFSVTEGGTSSGLFGTYVTGDRFRVAIENGVVKYLKNGAVFYTSTVGPVYPLLVDTSLYTPGATLSDVVLSGTLEWVGVDIPTFSLPTGHYETAQSVVITTRTPGAVIHYTTNAADPTESDPVIGSGDAMVVDRGLTIRARAWASGLFPSRIAAATYTVGATTTEDVMWTNAVNVTASGNGLSKSSGGNYWNAGAVSTKAIASQDGYVEFVASETTTKRALGLSYGDTDQNLADIDFAVNLHDNGTVNIYETGVNRGTFGTYATGDRFRVSVETGVVKYRKNGELLYTSTVAPTYPLLVDTSLNTVASTVQDVVISGELVVVGMDPPVFSLPSGHYLTPQSVTMTMSDPQAEIHYTTNGADPTEADPWIVTGGSVLVDHGLTLKARAFQPGFFPSTITSAVYSIGAIATEDVVWTNAVNVTVTGNDLRKSSGASVWDAGAVSTKGIVSIDGYVEFVASETGTRRMLGLSHGDTDQSSADIDFAVYLNGSAVYVLENGTNRGAAGTYVTGDRFRVSVETGVVKYRKNGELLYTSTIAPTYPLLVDTSLYTAGSALQDAVISGQLVVVGMDPPVFSLPTGHYLTPQTVTMTMSDPQAQIHYTTNGADPTEADPWIVTGGSVLVDHGLTLKARAFQPGFFPSRITTAAYTIGEVVTEDVVWTNAVNVTVTGNDLVKTGAAGWNAGAVSTKGIVSLDGYVEFVASETTTNRVLSLSYGDTDRSYTDIDFGIQLNVGTIYIVEAGVSHGAAGTYVTGDRFRVSVETGVVKYRKNGELLYTSAVAPRYPLLVDTSLHTVGATLRDVVISGQLVDVTLSAPTFSPEPGTFMTAQSVELTASDPGTEIRYTLDASVPTPTSTLYQAPILVEATTTISAKTFKAGWLASETAVATYIFRVATPVATPPGGNYAAPQLVTLTSETVGSEIRYTLDGSEPNTASALYAGPIVIGVTSVLKVKAFRTGWDPSDTATSLYNIAPPVLDAPTFSPAPGVFISSQAVALSAASGASIHYTIDGSDPTPASAVYSAPLLFEATTTVKAIAVQNGWQPSPVASGVYTIQVATPTLSPSGGSYTAPRLVTATSTPGATLRYTTNGVDPTPSDPDFPTSGLLVSQSLTLKVKGWKAGCEEGGVTEAAYTIAAPSVSLGYTHSLAVDGGGIAWAWGDNGSGQLGTGSYSQSRVPVSVPGITDAIAVAAGAYHSLALKSDGTVLAWGRNTNGQLGDGTTTNRTSPVSVLGLSGIVAIAAGDSHSLALGSDGVVHAWGLNSSGQLGDGTTTQRTSPVQVTGGLSGVVAIVAGATHSLAVVGDGTARAWGANTYGQLGDGTQIQKTAPVAVTGLTAVKAVAAGLSHSIAVLNDGTVRVWGYNNYGQLAENPTTVLFRPSPVMVPDLTGVANVAAGQYQSFAVKADGTVLGWGFGGYGQLGDGATVTRTLPVTVLVPTSVATVGSGAVAMHGVAVAVDRSVWAWGYNGYAQVGDGTITDRPTPVKVAEAEYLWKAGTPTFNPGTYTYTTPVSVTITTATPGATIRYTIDGSDPGPASPVYTSPVAIGQTTTLRARAFKTGLGDSNLAQASYSFKVPTPSFNPVPGTYAVAPQNVQVTCSNTTATIHYRTDGREPTEADPPYVSGTTIPVDRNTTLKAKAWKTGWATSDTATGAYTFKVAALTLTPGGGTYSAPQTVTLNTTTPLAVIRYNTEGHELVPTDPGVAPGTSISITNSQTLRAAAYRDGWTTSDPVTATYFLNLGPAAEPVADPPPGTYPGAQLVRLRSSTQGAVIRYTLDGADPTPQSAVFAAPIAVTSDLVLKARAFRMDAQASPVFAGSYLIQGNVVAAAILDVPSGFYKTQRSLVVHAPGGATAMTYTTDGRDPTEADATIADSGSILVDRSMVVKVRSWSGSEPGPIQRRDYVITGAVAMGHGHGLALAANEELWAWGYNGYGQIGDGTDYNNRTSPVKVLKDSSGTPLTGVKSIAAGHYHSMAIVADGTARTVRTWGYNGQGQLGDGTTTNRSYPVTANLTDVDCQTDVTEVAAAMVQSLAVCSGGTVYAWGGNDTGQLGIGATPTWTATPMKVGLSGRPPVVSVAASGYHSLALHDDGTISAWGSNSSGRLGDGTETSRSTPVSVLGVSGATSIAAGGPFSMALADGAVWSWGANPGGVFGDGTVNSRLVPGRGFSPAVVLGTGDAYAFAIDREGALWGTGLNTGQMIGDGGIASRLFPTRSLAPDHLLSVMAGDCTSIGIAADGHVWTWGGDFWGSLGNGPQEGPPAPAPIPGLRLVENDWLMADPDGDGLINIMEYRLGTDPLVFDTNGDGIGDGLEFEMGLDPANPDMDQDGLLNADELLKGTDPFKADTDGDGVLDGQDAFPHDPTLSNPTIDPNDHTPPQVTLEEPANAILVP